mgnify:CR=1 FL=1
MPGEKVVASLKVFGMLLSFSWVERPGCSVASLYHGVSHVPEQLAVSVSW